MPQRRCGLPREETLDDEETVKKALAELEDGLSASLVALPAGGGEAGLSGLLTVRPRPRNVGRWRPKSGGNDSRLPNCWKAFM